MQYRLKKTFVAILSAVLLYGVWQLYSTLSDEHFIKNFTCDPSLCKEWTTPQLSPKEQEELSAVLNQPFTYTGEGGQSYVFSSSDQKYVLKLFKFNRFRPSWIVAMLPGGTLFSPYRENHIEKREKKLKTVFTGHQLAYDLLRNESGLYFIQLSPSLNERKISIVDKIGLKRTIDLGRLVYVIQEKGETLSTVLKSLLDEGQVELVKIRIGQVIDLYHSEYLKGIYDIDHGVMHNIGFVGSKPIHLDVGKFIQDENIKNLEFYQQDRMKIAAKIRLWIEKNYPQYHEELAQAIEEKLKVD